jgi:hypothetical protein
MSLFLLPARQLPLAEDEKENRLPERRGRIGRPPSVYILFTKEGCKQVAAEYPKENNQEISTR